MSIPKRRDLRRSLTKEEKEKLNHLSPEEVKKATRKGIEDMKKAVNALKQRMHLTGRFYS